MNSTTLGKPRIQSLDLLRGIAMILMALDHVRHFFHAQSFESEPTDLSSTSVAFFATRWITHVCAPIFMLLAGTSAFLMGQKKSKREVSIFLLTRGLWLIFLEFTVIAFAWVFEMDFTFFAFPVIWALGICMVILSLLIWIPYPALLAIGLLLVAGHNLLDSYHVQDNTVGALFWKILHEEGSVALGKFNFYILYPILPWIGVMALGYCMGKLYVPDFDSQRRKKLLALLGFSAVSLFVVLRLANVYGDLVPWSKQPTAALSVISFFNTTKYPPSLLYLAMTLGPSLLFLAVSENIRNGASNVIKVFGRVPMFYYICHLYLIHLGSIALLYLQGFSLSDMEQGLPKGFGLNLGMTYLVWIAVVASLYPLCRWYDRYKSSHRDNKWLSYL